jgi:hypothetical protein
MTNNCKDALVSHWNTDILNWNSKIEYNMEKNRRKRIWNEALANLPNAIRARHNKIEDDFKEGYYVQPIYNSPAITPALLNSIGAGNLKSWYEKTIVNPVSNILLGCTNERAGCCYGSFMDARWCCVCSYERQRDNYVKSPYITQGANKDSEYNSPCNSDAACLSSCGHVATIPNGCNAKLSTNLFEREILRLKEVARREEEQKVAALESLYTSYREPTTLPSISIGCCQEIIFSGISGSKVEFNENTNKCTIINNDGTKVVYED